MLFLLFPLAFGAIGSLRTKKGAFLHVERTNSLFCLLLSYS